MTKKSKIKKRKLAAVVGTTLTILIVGIIAVGIWQRNNIKALWIALNEDTETIAEKQEQQKAKRQEILEKYEIVPNEEILASGNGIDIQAIIDEIQQGTEAAKNDESGSGTAVAGEEDEPNADMETTGKEAIQKYIAALYALEDQYLSELDQIVESTKTEFWSLPKEEQTKKNKLQLVQTKMSQLVEAEKQCDNEVEQILSAIQQVLYKQNEDNTLVEEIRAGFASEKLEKSNSKNTCALQKYHRWMKQVEKEVMYFPLPESVNDTKFKITFENSWMLERTYGGKTKAVTLWL